MTAEHRGNASGFLSKAREYLTAADDSTTAGRHTAAAGDAIHAGIAAKDAIVTALTGSTRKGKDHATAVKELRQALGKRAAAFQAEKALRELLSVKSDVEYGAALVFAAKSGVPLRRAHIVVDVAVQMLGLGP